MTKPRRTAHDTQDFGGVYCRRNSLNYKIDPRFAGTSHGIMKTGSAVDGLEVFGTYNQAKDALAVAVRDDIAKLKAVLKSALKVREKDLPVEPEPRVMTGAPPREAMEAGQSPAGDLPMTAATARTSTAFSAICRTT